MVLVYSATKGLSAMTLAIAHSRGWLDYEERDSSYAGANAVVGSRRASQYLRDDAVGGGVGSLLSARRRPRRYQADCDHFRRLAGAREADIPRQ
jgi:hypothetical protein